MYYLTYNQSGGRSGHKLKDICSVFILGMFLPNSIVCTHPSWHAQKILAYIDCPKLERFKFDSIFNVDKYVDKWAGISFYEVNSILSNIRKQPESTLIIFQSVFRIHPYQLHNWYIDGLIKEDLFTNKFLPLIRKYYYGDNCPKVNNVISIHIRRGDIAATSISRGFNVNYYTNIINLFNKQMNLPIHIYSENYNNSDLFQLEQLDNVELHFGSYVEFKDHFYQMVTSQYLLISSSSFSIWLAYLSKGFVFYHFGKISHFNHKIDPPNFIRYQLEDLGKIISLTYRYPMKTLIILFTSHRHGSTTFCDKINNSENMVSLYDLFNHSQSKYHLYDFNKDFKKMFEQICCDYKEDIINFKIFPDEPTIDLISDLLASLKSQYKVCGVILRRNLFDAYKSHQHALETGDWGTNPEQHQVFQENKDKMRAHLDMNKKYGLKILDFPLYESKINQYFEKVKELLSQNKIEFKQLWFGSLISENFDLPEFIHSLIN